MHPHKFLNYKGFVPIIFIALLLGILVVGAVVAKRQSGWSSKKSDNRQTEKYGKNDSKNQLKKVTTLVSKTGGRVDWSHSNDLIAFSKIGDDGYRDVYTMGPDGSNQICLTCGKSQVPQLSNDQPAWHQAGEWIAIQVQDPNLKLGALAESSPKVEQQLTQGGAGLNNNIWLVSKDGTRFHQLTFIRDKEGVLHPHFSHDGRKLFWAARIRDKLQFRWVLKVADFIDGANPKLTNERIYEPIPGYKFYESHGFTLDDSKLIFSASPSDREFDLDIFVMDLTSQKVENLTSTPGVWDEHSILSPDGSKLVWISSQGYDFKPTANYGSSLTTDYWLMNLDGSDKKRLTYFNEKGHSEYTGKRTIVADSSWNKSGDKIVGVLLITGIKPESNIVLLELNK